MSYYTILGASGFVGSQLVKILNSSGVDCYVPARGDNELFKRDLGRVFYCIGLTADFRQRPLETVDAHVCILNRLLREASFDRLIYFSSTRVYAGLSGKVNEDTQLVVNPNTPADLYNISKLMGESVCLQSGRDTVIARLSNVVGSDFTSDNFIFALIREACDGKLIRLRSAVESVKDFILLKDAVQALVALGECHHPKPIYNIASGRNLSNAQICEVIAGIEHCKWEVVTGAPLLSFPDIDISRARQDLGLMPSDVLGSLEDLVCQYRERKV